MTKNEALKAAIDGKKVRCRHCKEHDLAHRMLDSIRGNAQAFLDKSIDDSGFEIVPEYVDFAEALKAYRNSATIKSSTGEKYSLKREDETLCVNLKEIEGKWLILEDE